MRSGSLQDIDEIEEFKSSSVPQVLMKGLSDECILSILRHRDWPHNKTFLEVAEELKLT